MNPTLLPNTFQAISPCTAFLEGQIKMNVYRAIVTSIITSKKWFGRWINWGTEKLSNWPRSSGRLESKLAYPHSRSWVHDTKGFPNSWSLSTKSAKPQRRWIFTFTYIPNNSQVSTLQILDQPGVPITPCRPLQKNTLWLWWYFSLFLSTGCCDCKGMNIFHLLYPLANWRHSMHDCWLNESIKMLENTLWHKVGGGGVDFHNNIKVWHS